MSIVEKITIGVAIAGALGVGALLKSWVDHWLSRGEKKINIADKSVQIAEALMTRMEGELTRVQEALAKAQQESEELRMTLVETKTAKGKLSEQLKEAKKSLQGVNVQIGNASNAISDIQGEIRGVTLVRHRLYSTPEDQAMADRLTEIARAHAAGAARDVVTELKQRPRGV
ncbi:chromosome segregation ATPase [Micromonospora profundi]|uniref:hypothetical protein n=1 Tax=Micromonospora profundi TaxID=1420889 RepID=UPI00143A623B|nr:hypothetical protein [Micromonospora profundi]NJC10604.1 chromosome segregation ATPase [Micromonospora profundi]